MPIIDVYVGEIRIEASFRDGDREYLNAKISYGKTQGELLDNIAVSSLQLADEALTWVEANKSVGYSLKNDHWYCSISHPDLADCYIGNKEGKNYDMISGYTVSDIKEIPVTAIALRHRSIKHVLSLFAFSVKGPQKLPTSPITPYPSIDKAKNFEEMMSCGFTGAELDNILDIGVREGYLASYQSKRDELANPADKSKRWKRDKNKTSKNKKAA